MGDILTHLGIKDVAADGPVRCGDCSSNLHQIHRPCWPPAADVGWGGAVLLDNMTPETLRRAVAMVDGRAVTEASGRITPETAPAVAATSVDLISCGWITHSAPILDLGLDIVE